MGLSHEIKKGIKKVSHWAAEIDPWMAIKSMKSEDWAQAGLVVGGVALGALTGGVSAGLLGVSAGTGALVGGGLGLWQGESSAIQYHESKQAEREGKKAVARQIAENYAAEIESKQALLAAHQSMTAREAMARNINAAIRGMYSAKVKSGSDPVEAEDLGGTTEQLG